jgi:GNAT superfamily N-acetyltransferase
VSDPTTPARDPVIIHHLEMIARPDGAPLPAPCSGLTIVHAVRPTVRWYRYLYGSTGGPWQWTDRTRLSDEDLAAIIGDPDVSVHVLYRDGVPVGYIELDRRPAEQPPGSIEVAYFGLFPEALGQKLGPYLLSWGIHRAWDLGPRRVWVHTCSLDHPAALPLYQRLGFTIFHVEHEP